MPHGTPKATCQWSTLPAVFLAGSEGAGAMTHPHSSSRWLGLGDSSRMLLGSGSFLSCRLVPPAPSRSLPAVSHASSAGAWTMLHPHLRSCWLGWGTHHACCLVRAATLAVGWCCNASWHPPSNLMHSDSCHSGWLSRCADHAAPPLELALAGVGDSSGMLLGSGGFLRCRLVLQCAMAPSKQLDAL